MRGNSMNQKTANNQQQAAAEKLEPGRIESTSDQRAVNNTVRHQYRVLSDREKEQVESIKDAGADFLQLLDFIATQGSNGRELSLARTRVEEAVMWAVKHVTK